MYSMGQALNDLKNYYGLKDFKEVNLNIEDEKQPFIRFKSADNKWILTLKKEEEWTQHYLICFTS
mgnify:CR=1 FL=1